MHSYQVDCELFILYFYSIYDTFFIRWMAHLSPLHTMHPSTSELSIIPLLCKLCWISWERRWKMCKCKKETQGKQWNYLQGMKLKQWELINVIKKNMKNKLLSYRAHPFLSHFALYCSFIDFPLTKLWICRLETIFEL